MKLNVSGTNFCLNDKMQGLINKKILRLPYFDSIVAKTSLYHYKAILLAIRLPGDK